MRKIKIALILLILAGVLGGLFFDGYVGDFNQARPFPMFTIMLAIVSVMMSLRIYSDMNQEET